MLFTIREIKLLWLKRIIFIKQKIQMNNMNSNKVYKILMYLFSKNNLTVNLSRKVIYILYSFGIVDLVK